MQNDKIYSETINNLVTSKEEANILLDELDILSDSLYKIGDGNFESALIKDIRASTSSALAVLIKDNDKAEVLKSLKQILNNVKYISLTLAFEPTQEVIYSIVRWIRLNINPDLAVDITVDKSILGGVVIEYQGRIFKKTLASKLEEYFLNYAHL